MSLVKDRQEHLPHEWNKSCCHTAYGNASVMRACACACAAVQDTDIAARQCLTPIKNFIARLPRGAPARPNAKSGTGKATPERKVSIGKAPCACSAVSQCAHARMACPHYERGFRGGGGGWFRESVVTEPPSSRWCSVSWFGESACTCCARFRSMRAMSELRLAKGRAR